MKPVISAGNAWSCTVISLFAVIILSVIGALFKAEHEVVAGKTEDPPNPQVAAGTIFTAVGVYAEAGIDTDDGWSRSGRSFDRGFGGVTVDRDPTAVTASGTSNRRIRSRRRGEDGVGEASAYELWNMRRNRRRAKQD
ncbi:hypothetical protein TWF703_007024 [Orbilia oligospora]|uniref:Uncharacterized protein n=1 Tax=Orbilia oligospora TaxID=2813651 RepID=A0A7C8JQN9_ORBOL|nr:hypothetical protein TWF703_007024 [Orbilia oligospora]